MRIVCCALSRMPALPLSVALLSPVIACRCIAVYVVVGVLSLSGPCAVPIRSGYSLRMSFCVMSTPCPAGASLVMAWPFPWHGVLIVLFNPIAFALHCSVVFMRIACPCMRRACPCPAAARPCALPVMVPCRATGLPSHASACTRLPDPALTLPGSCLTWPTRPFRGIAVICSALPALLLSCVMVVHCQCPCPARPFPCMFLTCSVSRPALALVIYK